MNDDRRPSARPARHRGMGAVARLREIKERDSQLGLLQAITAVRDREEQVAELRAALATASAQPPATLAEFTAARRLLDAMAGQLGEAERRLAASRTVATEAHSRWQADRSRLRAIEHLLQQRALRDGEEQLRVERREVDDIVGQRYGTRRGDGRAPLGGSR